MVSDDTDHAVFVAQSLLKHPRSVDKFARRMGWCLRFWLLSLPAGVGFATLRSILKLCVGFPPRLSGVRSAGNGPAMRVAAVGAFFGGESDGSERYVEACTRITHTDPRALVGARTVASLAAWSMELDIAERPEPDAFFRRLWAIGGDDTEWLATLDRMKAACRADSSVAEFAEDLGLQRGVTGYIYHTVPVAAYAWYRHFGSFEETLVSVLDCGGDTDTTGAVAGALAGALVGEEGIPANWRKGILDWPRGLRRIGRMGDRLAEAAESGRRGDPVGYAWFLMPLRNLFFLCVVLFHGFRRLLPPYR
jgi:ADP-ribosylglycohydrolase